MAEANKLVVIVGPTASGKTALAIDIAKKYDGEIICADSRTIYRCMDIGTAKPTRQEQAEVRHHLLDIKDPNEPMSVVEFKTLCEKSINDIQNRGKIPFMVGGSGMYIDSVLYDYQFRSGKEKMVVADMSFEDKIAKVQELYPKSYTKIDIDNERRVDQLLRFGPAETTDRKAIKLECKILGISQNRLLLKHNIELRTQQMLNNKLVQETEIIISKFGRDCPGLNTIGYKQCLDYIDGKTLKSDLAGTINKATLDLAKRQMTWFKRNDGINWIGNLLKTQAICNSYLGNV